MASVIDICNLSLAHLGDEAAVSSITPPDGSAQADHCSRFYPMARDALLEMFAWSFATARSPLALSVVTPPDSWAFCYVYPTSCARILAVAYAGQDNTSSTQDYVIESVSDGSQVIYTNVESAVVVFTKRIIDPTKFSPLFTLCLSFLLASYLAGPITKDKGLAESMYKRFMVEYAKATYANANSGQNNMRYTAPWMAVRSLSAFSDGKIIR